MENTVLAAFGFLLNFAFKADGLVALTLFDDLFKTVERAAADEQNVLGVDLNELLIGMLASALGRNVGNRTLQNLEQRLLDALARNVAGDGAVFTLARDLVDFVDIDDASLG